MTDFTKTTKRCEMINLTTHKKINCHQSFRQNQRQVTHFSFSRINTNRSKFSNDKIARSLGFHYVRSNREDTFYCRRAWNAIIVFRKTSTKLVNGTRQKRFQLHLCLPCWVCDHPISYGFIDQKRYLVILRRCSSQVL